MNEFTHLDETGNARMVNVQSKAVTDRSAIARSVVVLPDVVWQQFGEGEIKTAKGSVFQTAIIAGIMAAKKTGELIPLCHPLPLENCFIQIHAEGNNLVIECTASITGKTGVEMEALVGASLAALTVYDMCKSMSHDIVIAETRLIEKKGGRNDFSRE